MKAKTLSGVILAVLSTCVVTGAGGAFEVSLRASRIPPDTKPLEPSGQNAATTAASDCAMLTPALLERVLGQPFENRHVETKAPPAYKGPWGWSCQYFSKKPASEGGARVHFVVYTEASAAVAKETFDKAAVFFADKAKPRPTVGDSAYWQAEDEDEPTIHVLKGKVHFSIAIDPGNRNQEIALAAALAAMQGAGINDKHVEVIVRQMTLKTRVVRSIVDTVALR